MSAIFDTDHLRWCLRFFAIVAAIPVVFGMVSVWVPVLAFVSVILVLPAFVILLVFGGVVMSWHGARDAAEYSGSRRIASAATAPVLTVAVFVLAWPLLATGDHVGWLTTLAANHRRYAAIVAEAERRVAHGDRDCCAGSPNDVFYIDRGPPIRAAFDARALLDNWSGIVFDPSGDVMQAKGFDPASGRFAAPDHVTKLFGGDLVRCRPLYGDYYRCSFT